VRWTDRLAAMAALAVALPAAGSANAEDPARACADLPVYAKLDFWVGDWLVFVGDAQVGTNRIERILDGCAVTETWTGSAGGEGRSLFWVASDGRWRQVWVTASATRSGGTKEKAELPGATSTEIRFQGEIRTQEGGSLDRTTLTRLGPDAVRQLIEFSTDGGSTWQVAFDATYRRRSSET